MKKSVKILFMALLVGLAVVMTSCGAMAAVMTEAGCLDGNTYAATVGSTSIRLAFKMEAGEYGHEKLNVTINGDSDSGYEWMLEPGEAVAEVKDIWIYKRGSSVSDRIGLLRPDSLNPETLTVVTWTGDDDETKGLIVPFGTMGTTSVVFVPASTTFNRIDN